MEKLWRFTEKRKIFQEKKETASSRPAHAPREESGRNSRMQERNGKKSKKRKKYKKEDLVNQRRGPSMPSTD